MIASRKRSALAALGGTRSSGPIWIPVSGSSMSPALLPGDEVLLEPLADRPSLCIGEVVVARLPSGWALHRVIAVDADGVVTRGDACEGADPRIRAKDAIYVAVLRRHEGLTGAIPSAQPPPKLRLRRAKLAARKSLSSALRYFRRSQRR